MKCDFCGFPLTEKEEANSNRYLSFACCYECAGKHTEISIGNTVNLNDKCKVDEGYIKDKRVKNKQSKTV